MKRSKIDLASEQVSEIRRNYPAWPSTFGECQTDTCNNSARGCGPCADCSEKALAAIIGEGYARDIHDAIKRQSEVWHGIKTILRGEDI